jgi:hypothetical protein
MIPSLNQVKRRALAETLDHLSEQFAVGEIIPRALKKQHRYRHLI